MTQSLLAVCQQASRELANPAPATIISNTDNYAVTLLNLVNGVGQQLMTEHQWQGLTKEYRFTTVFYTYTATTTDDSTTISAMSSTTGLTTNPTYFMVTGAGIPTDTYLVSVNAGASTAVLSRAATASGTAVSLTFSQCMYAMPSDYDRLIDRTQWDKSQFWELLGPGTAQQWQWLKSGYIAVGPRASFRVLASLFQVYPPLGANDYLGFEYVSNQWVAASGAALSKTAYAVDTDTGIFPDRLMISGLKFRWAEAMQLPRAPALEKEWMRQLSIAKAADAGNQTLSLSRAPGSVLITQANIPDVGYGL